MKILIKNGLVIDPANSINDVKDVLVDGGKISKVAKDIKESADTTIDATNKVVIPGIVDMHVHLREPGREDKETVETGTKAALKGGITSVLAMPNTEPAMDCAENIKKLKEIIKDTAQANVFISGAITVGRLGKELTDALRLKKEGAITITDDGSSVEDAELFLKQLENSAREKILVICHCEDKSLANKGVVNLGIISTILGLRGSPREAEYKRVERDINLAEKAGAAIHIAHVSCKESVDIISRAKKKGISVSCETAPHYFALDEEALMGYDTNLKINPPLRTKSDVAAIKQGLKDGTIDCIASDHAPHTENEKEIEFDRAEFGKIGLESSLAVSATELVKTKILTWPQLVEKMSLNPARILKIDKGTLGAGKDADITIISPDTEFIIKREEIVSKSKNSPFIGKKFTSKVDYTILSGKIVYTGK
ncbi:MAG: dihydroorotase [Candidatus Omnitrophica bacterium]|nr:dihydroorotase [Candidatus Omnitrophota bacterium]HOX54907.1 dihydroorotase [Candidatus Omnitrophota bacterium]